MATFLTRLGARLQTGLSLDVQPSRRKVSFGGSPIPDEDVEQKIDPSYYPGPANDVP
jgi:hypothetical protein